VVIRPGLQFLVLLMSLCCCNGVDCNRFSQGTFVLYEDGEAITEIYRYEMIQMERSIESGEEYLFKVKWISECTYILTDFGKPGILEDFALQVDIIETGNTYYIQESSVDGEDYKYRSRIEMQSNQIEVEILAYLRSLNSGRNKSRNFE